MRSQDHNIYLRKNSVFSDFVDSLEHTTKNIREALLPESLNLLLFSIQSRDKDKFTHQAAQCQDIKVNDIVLSRTDYIDSGSIGQSIMKILSLNKTASQAVVAKSRPASTDKNVYKRPLMLTRAVDQLYLIVSNCGIEEAKIDESIQHLEIQKLLTVKPIKLGSIID